MANDIVERKGYGSFYKDLPLYDSANPYVEYKDCSTKEPLGYKSVSELFSSYGYAVGMLTGEGGYVNIFEGKDSLNDISQFKTMYSMTLWFYDVESSYVRSDRWQNAKAYCTISFANSFPTFRLYADTSEAVTDYVWENSESDNISTEKTKVYLEQSSEPSLDYDVTNEVTFQAPLADHSKTGTCKIYCYGKDIPVTFKEYGADYIYKMDLSSYYIVTTRPIAVSSVSVSGTDSNAYYDSDLKVFQKPKGMTINVTMNSATVKSFAADSDSVSYYLDEAMENSAIGQKMAHNSNARVYFEIALNDYMRNVATGSIEIDYEECRPTYVSSQGKVILTSKPSDHHAEMGENGTLSAVFNDGQTLNLRYSATGSDGWRFASPDARVMGEIDSIDVIISMYGHATTLSVPVECSNPTYSRSSFSIGSKLSSALANGSAIDLTDSYLRATYSDSDYVGEISYSEGNQSADGKYTASCDALDASYEYDGSQSASFDMGGSLKKSISISLSGTDSFGNALSYSLPITVFEISDIVGLSCISPKTSYKIGEEFLNEDDGTKVKVWHKDSEGNKESVTIFLNASYGSLSVYPTKGTRFTSAGTVTVRVQSVFDTSKYFTYDITVEKSVKLSSDTQNMTFRFYKLPNAIEYKTETDTAKLSAGTYIKVLSSDTRVEEGRIALNGTLAGSYSDPFGIKIYGYLQNVGDTESNGVLVDFNDYVPPITGSSNATIKFPCYDAEASSFVDKCSFGVRFGHNNSLNRLFISGNPDMPNYDIHSVEPNLNNEDEGTQVKDGDFSYFPDEALCRYGESENSIVGYDVVSDSKLLVLKDRSAKEKTIYFRVPTMVTMLDSAGNVQKDVSGNTLYQEEYSVYMSNSSVAGVSPDSIANFNGDTLFVDDGNEVAGLDIEGIIGDSQRQANSRSKYIDRKLREFDMSEANLQTFGNYLILDIPGEACFIANRESLSGSQYEWWRLDSLDSRCFMEMDGVLYYATEDGTICRLAEGEYSDKDRYFINVGLTQVGWDNDIITSSEYTSEMSDDYLFTWKTIPEGDGYKSYIYARILDTTSDGNAYVDKTTRTIELNDESVADDIGVGNVFYLNSGDVPLSDSLYGVPYRLENVECETGNVDKASKVTSFRLLNEDYSELTDDEFDQILKDSEGTFTVCKRLDGEIIAKKVGDGEIKLYDDSGDAYDLVQYSDQSAKMSISGVLTRVRPIRSRLVSAPLLISSANWFKHVIKLDISEGTNDVSDIMVAYCNNRVPYIVEEDVKDRGQTIDLGAFSFTDVDFSSNFYTRTYTIGKELKCIKYICVAFASDKDMNSVVPSVSMTYILSRLSKGIAD